MNTPQFDLGAMLSAPQTAIQQIPCDQLKPYHNHKFELYSGERLEDIPKMRSCGYGRHTTV